MKTISHHSKNEIALAREFLKAAKNRKYRSMADFAEQEIVIPDGPFQGWRYSCDRQPYSRLFFNEVDSGRWNRFFATGPTQSGKTLSTFVIPLLFHLFEVGEKVVVGLPTMDMAKDKWEVDILPIITASRFEDYLPKRGAGSKGGTPTLIKFGNGSAMKFQTGGGSDKQRAGFTSRVLCITETDGMDRIGGNSREADQITQLEVRLRAYGDRKRVYAECTTSTTQGRTWREYTSGSRTRIILQCPHCQQWVSPEREHLRGWQDAETEKLAVKNACFTCPECSEVWSEDERKTANINARVIHGEQAIENNQVSGELPETKTLGFRWSAVNNLFLTAGDVAEDEFKANQDPDQENAEKKLKQFVWALPYEPDREDAIDLSWETITKRQHSLERGQFPENVQHITIGFDSGKYQSWYVELAWTPEHRAHIVDYGSVAVSTNDLGIEAALLATLHQFADDCVMSSKIPDAVWFDCSFETQIHYRFAREVNSHLFQPVQGYGETQRNGNYSHPKSRKGQVRWIGEQMNAVRDKENRIIRVDLNADYWKTQAHKSISGPVDRPCSTTLFKAPNREHSTFAKHMLAETKVEEFIAGRGVVTRWEKKNKANHLFDCLAYAMAAGARLGHSTVIESKPPVPNVVEESTPDGAWQNYCWNH